MSDKEILIQMFQNSEMVEVKDRTYLLFREFIIEDLCIKAGLHTKFIFDAYGKFVKLGNY